MTLPAIPAIHNYWVVKPSSRGDKTQDRVLRAMGAALITWERYESRLAELFTIFVQCPTEAAERAYGTIVTHRGRCDMMSAAAEVYFAVNRTGKEVTECFYLLLRHSVSHASGIRNQIAHGTTVQPISYFRKLAPGVDMRKPLRNKKVMGWFLVPPAYSTSKRPFLVKLDDDDWADIHFAFLRVKYRYTSTDIETFGRKFEMLADAAKHLCQHLDPKNAHQRPNG